MDTGGDRGERDEIDGGGSGISRRRFLAGGVMTIGGASSLIADTTRARFSDGDVANGVVQINGSPSLDYRIYDKTANTNAQFKIAWQIEWLSDFDRIEIVADNLDKSYISPTSFTRRNPEGILDYPQSGSHGNGENDTYEFQFDVYRTESSQPVISKTVTDKADGNGTGNGDFGNPNGPKITRIAVEDNSQNTNTDYLVTYELANASNGCANVEVVFDNQAKDWADRSKAGSCNATGTVTYSQGGTMGQEYHITVKVTNSNDIEVASATIEDVPDGTDSEEQF